MFYESDQHYDDSEYGSDDDNDDDSDSSREEVEAALYAQIHFDHEEDDCVLYNGYSTSVQTVGPKSSLRQDTFTGTIENSVTQVDHGQNNTPPRSTLTESGTVSSPICLNSSSSISTGSTVSSDDDDRENYFKSDDSDFTDSDECMVLDETVDITGDIMVHVNKNQQAILQSEQTENDVWKISEMDEKPSNNHTLTRYYNPMTTIRVQCYNCKEMGHLSTVCPKPKKSEICHLCGMTGHFFRKCPQGICYNCSGPGHISNDCPKQRKRRGEFCTRCLMPGHNMNSCPDIWRQFHLTTCEGPVKQIEMKQNPKRYCCNCASRQHFGFECVKDRMEKYEHGNYPFISTYTYKVKSSKTHKDKKSKTQKDKSSKTHKDKSSKRGTKRAETSHVETQIENKAAGYYDGRSNWDNMPYKSVDKKANRKQKDEQHIVKGTKGKQKENQPKQKGTKGKQKVKEKVTKGKKQDCQPEQAGKKRKYKDEQHTEASQGKRRKTENTMITGQNSQVNANSKMKKKSEKHDSNKLDTVAVTNDRGTKRKHQDEKQTGTKEKQSKMENKINSEEDPGSKSKKKKNKKKKKLKNNGNTEAVPGVQIESISKPIQEKQQTESGSKPIQEKQQKKQKKSQKAQKKNITKNKQQDNQSQNKEPVNSYRGFKASVNTSSVYTGMKISIQNTKQNSKRDIVLNN
ncbi:zinc finger CCHC domain-containing protein 7-like isoform X2 [Argopecten irradians]|uniref:zinc finger CCHC domain-containing protein 7-like isoform X2 n=1 Tax=Argopecten irradians TaxID=31199 RepID=UPI00371A0F74